MTERQIKQIFFLDLCDCGLTVDQDKYCICKVRQAVRGKIKCDICDIQTIVMLHCIT